MDVVAEDNVVVGDQDHCEHLTSTDTGTLIKVSVRDEVLGNKVYCQKCKAELLALH